MYTASVISILLLNSVKNSSQIYLFSDDGVRGEMGEGVIRAADADVGIVKDLRASIGHLNEVKDDILDSLRVQEKGVITMNKLLDGPGKGFEDAEIIREEVIERVKSSAKLAKTIIAIIDSVIPPMNEKIDEIVKCISEEVSSEAGKRCNSYINDAYTLSVNTTKFIDKRFLSIVKDDQYIQNMLNELSLRLQNKSSPHSREEIIGAYGNNFSNAIGNIKMYFKLVEEKRNYITAESEKISDLRTSCMRSLKAIKRFNKVEAENLLTKITHEYMFMKHTEDDVYSYIEDVLHVLYDAENMANAMITKFNGNDQLVLDDIIGSLDNINEIIENVAFTFDEEGNLYRAITTFKVSVEKNRRLVEKANAFVDDLLVTRNRDVFKPFKKPFEYLTIKNVIDSIKLLKNAKMDLQEKMSKVVQITQTEGLVFKALGIVSEEGYKPKTFHEKLFEIGKGIEDQCKHIFDDVNGLIVIHKYDQTILYMSSCLSQHLGDKDSANTNDNMGDGKLQSSKDCKEAFRLLWNLNDKHAKNKIDKALVALREKLEAQRLVLAISILSRDYDAMGKDMGVMLNDIAMKNPDVGNFISAVSDKQLEKMLAKF
ncbi:hypothetical protein BMR1_01G00395 [Babesia microti strain RI]|uniref:Uncharacterized protein n=1 Tax=Babesia microti (strain RI) TaxID=1133968 RepID=I7INZ9_BABMR|nr:hypothetical protein BMR1_01G00395 [Babesia microti strain RI]CCF72550.1 hypothetical protein BMR1_01G00395 [Babesia microti strain RI]|eukprot:XP_012647159.1 hypothetical protein BMR1_01G00395 [Babesia microti strain RI]